MSQSSISPSACRWLSALAALSIAGCSTTESYEFGQSIEMGPWTFEVERVRDRVETGSAVGARLVPVDVRVIVLTVKPLRSNTQATVSDRVTRSAHDQTGDWHLLGLSTSVGALRIFDL